MNGEINYKIAKQYANSSCPECSGGGINWEIVGAPPEERIEKYCFCVNTARAQENVEPE